MLALSRHPGQAVVFTLPNGETIQVRVDSRVQLQCDAPAGVRISRDDTRVCVRRSRDLRPRRRM